MLGQRESREQVCRLLRELRQRSALRQSDVAAQLGREQSFVSKYETGERRLDIVELQLVCQALGVPLGDFVTRLEDRLNAR